MTIYFYDSYAIIEFINNNKKFDFYFLENEGFTTFYNILEVYYSILKEGGTPEAKKVIEQLQSILVNPQLEDINYSMNFKLKYKKKKFSYTDCLGYTIAKRMQIKFLTGDESFRNISNVEFIKR